MHRYPLFDQIRQGEFGWIGEIDTGQIEDLFPMSFFDARIAKVQYQGQHGVEFFYGRFELRYHFVTGQTFPGQEHGFIAFTEFSLQHGRI